MKSQWFVIHTLAGQEQKVKDSIERRLKTEEMGEYIQEVLVPMEKVAEVRAGKKTVTNRKLYPGYVFIDMVLLDEEQRIVDKPWYFVRDTQGIIGFVGGDRPTPTPSDEIESIKAQIMFLNQFIGRDGVLRLQYDARKEKDFFPLRMA